MSQPMLHEQIVAMPPRTASRLEPVPASVRTRHEPAPVLAPQLRDRSGMALLRAIGGAVAFALRTVGVVLAIGVAALSVGAMVVVQRILHLG